MMVAPEASRCAERLLLGRTAPAVLESAEIRSWRALVAEEETRQNQGAVRKEWISSVSSRAWAEHRNRSSPRRRASRERSRRPRPELLSSCRLSAKVCGGNVKRKQGWRRLKIVADGGDLSLESKGFEASR